MAGKADKIKRVLEREDNSPEQSFAPPIPALSPVEGFAPRTAPRTPVPQPQPQPNLPSKPSIGTSLARGIGRAISRLFVLLTPMNSGPDGTGDLYPGPYVPPIPELEEVTVTPPTQTWPELEEVTARPPRKPTSNPPATVPSDPYNFGDILDFSWPIHFPKIGYPDLDLSRPRNRPAPIAPIDPRVLPTPTGPEVFADPVPDRISAPAPSTPAPTFFPDPFGFPTLEPFRPGSPSPLPSDRPRTVTRPGERPGPATGPRSPLVTPLPEMPGFPRIEDNPRPPRPAPGLPDFFTDPSPDLLTDPSPEPLGDPDRADPCNCEKPAKKKKKPPAERAVCKQGTYTQRKKGIKYSPRRTVPCTKGDVVPERVVRKKSKAKAGRPSLPSLITI